MNKSQTSYLFTALRFARSNEVKSSILQTSKWSWGTLFLLIYMGLKPTEKGDLESHSGAIMFVKLQR